MVVTVGLALEIWMRVLVSEAFLCKSKKITLALKQNLSRLLLSPLLGPKLVERLL